MNVYQRGIERLTGWGQKIKTGFPHDTKILAASLILTMAVSVMQLQQSEKERLQERFELQEKICELEERALDRESELRELEERYRELERHTRELEKLLSSLRRTYQVVIQGDGCKMPVLSASGFTAAMFERVWDNRGAEWLRGTGQALVEAEHDWGVNALVLAAMIVHESGWYGSGLARNKNNLVGLAAAGEDPYANALSFNSKRDCIDYAAEMLSKQYLSRSGRFYRGEDLRGVAVHYAADPFWAYKVSRHMAAIMKVAVKDPESLLSYAGWAAELTVEEEKK